MAQIIEIQGRKALESKMKDIFESVPFDCLAPFKFHSVSFSNWRKDQFVKFMHRPSKNGQESNDYFVFIVMGPITAQYYRQVAIADNKVLSEKFSCEVKIPKRSGLFKTKMKSVNVTNQSGAWWNILMGAMKKIFLALKRFQTDLATEQKAKIDQYAKDVEAANDRLIIMQSSGLI